MHLYPPLVGLVCIFLRSTLGAYDEVNTMKAAIAELQTQLNLILGALESHGLVASS